MLESESGMYVGRLGENKGEVHRFQFMGVLVGGRVCR